MTWISSLHKLKRGPDFSGPLVGEYSLAAVLAAEDSPPANPVFQSGDTEERQDADGTEHGFGIVWSAKEEHECGKGEDARDNRV